MIQCRLRKLFAYFTAIMIVFAHSASFSEENLQGWEDRYKSEPYIRILKEVEVKINKDYSYTETMHIIDKIQNEGGKKQGEIAIDYDQSREEITDIEAHTILHDGTKLPYEKIQDINAPGNFGVYSDNRIKMITMPGVVVGTIVEWKYTKKARPVIENHFYDAFRLTCTCPIKESRYKITALKDMKLNFKSLNIKIDPKVENAGDKVYYTWETRNNEKDEFEEYMPSEEEHIKRVLVSTLNDWKELSDWAWSMNQKNLKITPEMRKKILELTNNKKIMADKIKAIIEYLQSDFRYVSMNIGSHSYEPHPSDEIFLNKYGDCKDQTLLAVAMLSEIGVKAWPTLMSTSSELRRLDLLPMPFYFDHAILNFELDGKRYYTDVLINGYNFHEVPAMLSGKRVFVINDQGGYFAEIPLTDNLETTNVSNEKVLIRDDGTAVIEINVTFSRNSSIGLRERLKNVSADEKEKFFAALETSLVMGGKLLEKVWKNTDIPNAQVSLFLKFEHTAWIQKMGDMMMFGMPQKQRGKLFSSAKRRYPIVFLNPSLTESNVSYTIPVGYEVLSLPKRISLETAFATYTREYVSEGAKITGREVFSFKRAHVPNTGYQTVQNFFDEIPRSTNDKIIIKKKREE